MKHFCLTILALGFAVAAATGADPRPRLLVLTDIGGDPDDQQSLVRLLLYANEFEIEGLIASASGTPGELKKSVVNPQLIRDSVEAYAVVFHSLTNHAAGYPAPDHLRSIIKTGNPRRGRFAVGEGEETEASNYIIELVNRPDPRPLNIAIWGGQTDLAQACWQVRDEHGNAGLTAFRSRIRVYDIADQDGIFDWMKEEFSFPFYVLNKSQPGHDRREAAFRGMYLGGDESLTSREWIELNVRTAHGPLGALYPARTWTAPNPNSALKEGDTPSFFYFLPHGLNDPNFPDYGGWGGRFKMVEGVWRDDHDTLDGVTDGRATISRWRRAFQNDFEARMDWCVNNFHNANHAPALTVNGDTSRRIIRIGGRAGETIRLNATLSVDPDGDQMTFRWWRYWEPGSFPGEIELNDADQAVAELKVPEIHQSSTAHVILEVTDDGSPVLTSFRRVVVELLPDR